MVKFSGSELVAMTKTRSSARIPVADEHTAYPDVDAFTVVAAILQYPPTMPAKFVPLPPTTNRVVLAYSDVTRVVEAFPNVERPVTFSVPAVAKLPLAAVVVAYPFTIKFPVVERIVVVAFPRVVSPVTDSVPSTEILVPMLVAYTNPETKRTEHNTDKTTERTL